MFENAVILLFELIFKIFSRWRFTIRLTLPVIKYKQRVSIHCFFKFENLARNNYSGDYWLGNKIGNGRKSE